MIFNLVQEVDADARAMIESQRKRGHRRASVLSNSEYKKYKAKPNLRGAPRRCGLELQTKANFTARRCASPALSCDHTDLRFI
jgi:hypothetical protein